MPMPGVPDTTVLPGLVEGAEVLAEPEGELRPGELLASEGGALGCSKDVEHLQI
jgi:hypothetical protein